MLLKPSIRPLFLALAIVVLGPNRIVADVVVERDSTIYGKITEATEEHVSIARGCDANNVTTIPKNRVRFWRRDSDCGPHTASIPANARSECLHAKRFFLVSFFGRSEGTIVRDFQLNTSNQATLKLAMNWGILNGPADKIESVASICLADSDWSVGANEFWAPQTYQFTLRGDAARPAVFPGF